MLSLRQMLCLYLPWHKFVRRVRLSKQSDYLRCSCGKEYAINFDCRMAVPFDDVRSVYDEKVLRKVYG